MYSKPFPDFAHNLVSNAISPKMIRLAPDLASLNSTTETFSKQVFYVSKRKLLICVDVIRI